MGRRKRSEKVAEAAVKVKPVPSVAPPRVAAERVVAALCPVCVQPETKVFTGAGFRQIKTLNVGEQVVGFSGGQLIENVVTTRYYSGDMIEVKPRYLKPVAFTPEHPILVGTVWEFYGKYRVRNITFKPASSLLADHRKHGKFDCVVIPKVNSGTPQHLNFEAFSRKVYLLPAPLRGSVELDEELAEFFGWYVSEGHVTVKEVGISLNADDEEDIKRVTELVSKKLGYTYYIRRSRRDKAVQVAINSRVLQKALVEWLGKGARHKRIPEFLFQAEGNIIQAFLRGYFRGDGYTREDRRNGHYRLSASTVSEELAEQLQMLSTQVHLWLGLRLDTSDRSHIQGRKVNTAPRYILEGTTSQLSHRMVYEDEKFYYVPIMGLRNFHYEGPVCNLETEEGVYLLPFIVHNCGRTIPEGRAVKIGYITVGKTPYFETIQWDENKPFGVVFEASGRGSFQEWQHISPEEAPELFKAVKERFLEALREWVVVKKWITQDELETVSIARGNEVDRMRIQADNK